jgi:hypothetical protein
MSNLNYSNLPKVFTYLKELVKADKAAMLISDNELREILYRGKGSTCIKNLFRDQCA